MAIGITIIFVSLMYILLLAIIYFSKKRVSNIETKIYNKLLMVSIAGLFIEFACCMTVSKIIDIDILKYSVNKLFLLSILLWVFLFSKYTISVSFNNNSKLAKKINNKYKIFSNLFLVFFIVFLVIILFLPINYFFDGIYVFSYGPAINFVFVGVGFFITLTVLCVFLNIKNTPRKKIIPMFVFLFFILVTMVFRLFYPGILLINATMTFVTVLMYFTIENPDLKTISELEVAREQADKANRAKTDFLSSMSHEIRTPLNAIVGFSECIADAKNLDEAKENAHDIVNASQTLLEIVNGILDISKIEAGKIEIVNSPYNARELFDDLATLITPKMNEKGLDFTYKIAPDIPQTLYGDHANLKKIITNLLSNSAKYTEHGFVHYEVNCVNSGKYSKLIITVEDSGRGIKKENIDKLFTKFQRLDEDKNTTIEGTGLGLAITKQLIELMGGRVIVHTIYGEGSKFTVVINQRIEEEKITEKHRVLDTLDLNNIKLLLVDDNSLNIKVASKILEKFNANMVTSVSSGFECLDKIKAGEQYDVILLDDMMPKMSGVETLQELKKIEGFNTPVVALTANAITGMREKYISDGFNDYLAKPIEKDQLIKVMNEILGRNITNQIPVEEIKEETPEEKEHEQEEEKNRILQVSENDIDLIKNQKLISETSKINIVDNNLDKVSMLSNNDNKTEELLEDNEVNNIIDVPTDLLNNNSEVIEPPQINGEEYLRGKGVDLDQALENLGDMEMYNDTVGDYLSEVEEKWQRIEDYKLQGNMSDYAIEVHSLKSDSRYLGLTKLADNAYQHELASKENNVEFVNNNFNILEEEYHKALDILKNYRDNYLK